MFKTLTGRKFEMQCLSSVFSSRGLTQATFALQEKMLYLKLLFIAINNGVLKGSAAILIKAWGILSWVWFLKTLRNFVTIYKRKDCVIIIIFILL